MTPFVRAHYPGAENRIRVEVQWASPDLLKIAHDATSYAGGRSSRQFLVWKR